MASVASTKAVNKARSWAGLARMAGALPVARNAFCSASALDVKPRMRAVALSRSTLQHRDSTLAHNRCAVKHAAPNESPSSTAAGCARDARNNS
eukprot:6092552-Pyramimonas_sp.AAC.1